MSAPANESLLSRLGAGWNSSEDLTENLRRLKRNARAICREAAATGTTSEKLVQNTITQICDTLRNLTVSEPPCNSYMIWIDGVGAWQLGIGQSFTIGAPSFEKKSADIALLANISRQHAALHHNAENWHVTADQPTTVSGRTVTKSIGIRSGDELCLADRVRLGFRLPSVLSSSAVIDFESNHRPTHTVDGIILMVDHCLLGPRRDHHVCCPEWPHVVVLYHQDGQLRCRSAFAMKVNGKTVSDSSPLEHGSIVEAEDLRFRIEEIR